MSQQLKGLVIDPEKRTITEVVVTGDYRDIYKHIGCDCFTVVKLDNINCVYVDDEGLLKNPRYFFKLKGYNQEVRFLLAGKGLVLGLNWAGDTRSTTLDAEKLLPLVEFVELVAFG